tara:strand:- start:9 stop:425 length:417 start_codon:yes stop_codon:yes gene_type:complete
MNEEQNTPNFEGEEMKMPENSNYVAPETETRRGTVVNAPLLLILAVLLIVILGGMYYWFGKLNMEAQQPLPAPTERPSAEENNEPESTTAETQTEVIETTSTSDEVTAIEADLESTDLDSIDAEMNAIEAEIDAALIQ